MPTDFNYDYSFNKQKKSIHKNNEEIIKNFAILKEYTKKLKQPFKTKAYTTAIQNIKGLDFDITNSTIHIIKQRNLVGKKLYDKIVEYLKTGTMKAVENVRKEYQSNQLLLIKGFGLLAVEKLKKEGIYTIEDLRKKQNELSLSHQQKLGIKYYTDLSIPILRQEIQQIYKKLQPILKSFNHEITGSYRRKAQQSNDMDIVISCNIKNCPELFYKKIKEFPDFVDKLSLGKRKFSFLIRNNGVVRQVDLLVVPPESYYTAIFHFTGSGTFNENIRSFVKKKGITINEYSITKNGKKYYPKSEKEIFELIKLKYLEPSKRIPENVKFL